MNCILFFLDLDSDIKLGNPMIHNDHQNKPSPWFSISMAHFPERPLSPSIEAIEWDFTTRVSFPGDALQGFIAFKVPITELMPDQYNISHQFITVGPVPKVPINNNKGSLSTLKKKKKEKNNK